MRFVSSDDSRVFYVLCKSKVRDKLLHCTQSCNCTPSSKGDVTCWNVFDIPVSGCPGPGNSWGNPDYPPASKIIKVPISKGHPRLKNNDSFSSYENPTT